MAWVEEDWTKYEWIGLCRDKKMQRAEELVIIVSSAQWSNPTYPVSAVETPELMRNNIGCWGFQGTAKREYTHFSWSGGKISVTAGPQFTATPTGQYTAAAEGRLRVPIAAPLFAGSTIVLSEAYADGECSYSATYNGSTGSIVQGGTSVGNLVIRYFRDAEPDWLRPDQDLLLEFLPRAYFAEGHTSQLVNGTASGDETCAGPYQTAVGAWLLTHDADHSPWHVLPDGHLKGTFHPPSTNDSTTFTWDLTPVREP